MSGERRHPVFARFYERLSLRVEGLESSARAETCGPAAGRVLEIGSGNGLNFARYRMASLVVAAEPEAEMRRLAAPRAAAAPVPVRQVAAEAGGLPFDGGAFDTVVASLVLCSVPDQAAAVAELRRVLRPGGVVRFFEHVRATGAAARLQDLVERPWGFFGGGCHPNRDTVGALRAGGFTVRVRDLPIAFPGAGLLPHVVGEAR